MTQSRKQIAVLGAGPAGLGAAYRLAQRQEFGVTVVERGAAVGGNAGSFNVEGLRVDYGSHRLHPSCPPEIMADIKNLLADDLLERPRHGRILLRGRWVHFPLKPFNLLTNVPPDFLVGVARDSVFKHFVNGKDETFESVLQHGLGQTICRDFYFPYARKIWGVPSSDLDPEQARRRVSGSSLTKLARKMLRAAPGVRSNGAGRFFYPRKGFGQISEAYHNAAVESGADVLLQTEVKAVALESGRVRFVEVEGPEGSRQLEVDQVFSSIPITVLARMINPSAPADVAEAARKLRFRAMILIYLVLGTHQFTEFDAHYFPGSDIPITRLSEPKNYSLSEHRGKTVLCAELPCSTEDESWKANDAELGDLVLEALRAASLPVSAPVLEVATRRLPNAYPIYDRGFSEQFRRVDRWLEGIEGLLTMVRQGLFAHDNTHHTLAMAYCAVDCLNASGSFDHDAWSKHRLAFEKHVVED